MLATIETFLSVQAKQNMSVGWFEPTVCQFATLDLNFTELVQAIVQLNRTIYV